MSDQFALVIEGLESLADFEKLPAEILRSARIAVNDAATRGRTRMAKEVLSQIALPASYVAPSAGRLHVSKKASNSDLESIISARSRATSLARFAKGSSKGGVRVAVRPGATRTIPGAFLIKLRAGSASTDTKSNLGLAVRTKDGLPPPSAYKPKKLGNNLWLLYGPSVAQSLIAARGDSGIAHDLTPDIQDMLEAEFLRQMRL